MKKKRKNPRLVLGKKLLTVLFIFSIVFSALIFRLFFIMFVHSDTYKAKVLNQRVSKITLYPKRGDILDRNGNKLATSISDYRVDVDMNTLRESLKFEKMTLKTLSDKLSKILGTSSDKIYSTLSAKSPDGVPLRFVNLARQISKTKVDNIKALNITGFISSEDSIREYPNNNFLSSVLGYTRSDGSGASGVELSYNKTLAGIPGYKSVETDVTRKQLPYGTYKYVAPKDGKNVVLTIDKNIQLIAEQAAQQALTDNKAKAVNITVMDPKTGEILAMVNKPDYNPNTPYAKQDGVSTDVANLFQANAVQQTFEPGSIFKVVTAYTGLATGTVKDTNAMDFDCNGSLSVNGTIIHCWQLSGHGYENFVDILKHSCNVGFMQLGQRIGKDNLLKYIHLFGFGQKTGIDLPGEATGIVRDTDKVNLVDLSNIAFGQGISVTSVQYMAALNSIANGGTWIRPHVMKEITENKNGQAVTDSKYSNYGKRNILDPNITTMLRGYLERVVSDNDGVGKNADIPGYHIAGKTGTAQKADPKTGGYSAGKYMSSFAGMAPSYDPQVTLLVSVDEPSNGSYYASDTAAPVVKQIYQQIFDYLSLNGKLNLSGNPQN
ncbi:stage V sporulation protein D (sporulation-specific penicillin-binding protein) [Clostridium acetobutylicum]|uniref:Sporulation specific penicillin-binding protein n=1 Tax=Clostridium acetobutylicum (strain ATCC 824 / DSM 792 / JCM 1419 / IAM 19013 / LMG 5710 / NBRC 13948 / NRRL B-527 / VKM B-1787 / 2291 / W) TaxID=272562 RepID=Q97M69_CLOAB|nr:MULTISPECIES: penicillin-binding transpeptidase domain-containing protein [Clostridium]AAK78310.1 Sporulation specific penicillin-binding protein [Clostridium acetobutylicum ATCC 824]ADZ19379.1 Sporulation specific penicillin-binding protein [Clostridium acetobutylicum EA 2018]AEI34660.1 sporulation specific penicillin-binding protein [Clostridium acetobutylicum DSM 1731]AWV80035.1 stage V sporulation protein D [Clostridium acetobutylicum]KHD35386.1 stage V sporulation protein D [Clostridiu